MPAADIQANASSHVVADQGEVAAFLAAPETHGGAPVTRFDTHGAMVFVAGGLAYKVKRAVRFAYMDFSTLARRRAACEKEVAINRRTAPELYLGVRPVLRDAGGALRLGAADEGDGAAVEWVIVMRAFAQDSLFDHLAARGALTPDLLVQLADEIRRFHQAAEVIAPGGVGRGGAQGMRDTEEENNQDLVERPDLFAADEVRRLRADSLAAIERCATLLDARWAEGLVRRCHGDLHLRNICLIDGRPTLFDAIEFSDAIACIDVLYDLAFLLMDLDHRGLRPAANLVLNRYLQDDDGLPALAALPLFFSVRAAVRAKVAAAAEASQQGDARRAKRDEAAGYFAAARAYLTPPPPLLLAVGGLSGTGKTTLARALAPELGAAPGALLLRSDTTRKALFGAGELERLPQEAYTPSASEEVYALLLERARQALAAGHAVVLDAVHGRPAERAAAEDLARAAGVAFTGLWLEADLVTLDARTAARRGDASDATPAVVREQARQASGAIGWQRLSAGGAPEQVAAAARRLLAAAGG